MDVLSKVLSKICYEASRLSVLADDGKYAHMVRILDGRGVPTKKEILASKKRLDGYFEELKHGR